LAHSGRTKLISFLRNYPRLNSRFQELIPGASGWSVESADWPNYQLVGSCQLVLALLESLVFLAAHAPISSKATYQSHKRYQRAPQRAKDSAKDSTRRRRVFRLD
jgi:hypothetical protein